MTRRPGVTKQEVFDAANRLKIMGKPVTALQVLTLLGGGSLTTIYKHLYEWETQSRPAPMSAAGDELRHGQLASKAAESYEPPESLMNAFHDIWKLAVQEAERHVAESQKSEMQRLQEEIDTLKKKLLSK